MQEEYIIRILLAAAVGGAIGLEREYRDKSAGFRTMILIATGSAFFTILSDVMGESIQDNARIAAAVVSGIGFLGAGVILKDGDTIKGMTTAASIWLVSSLGMGMALGLYELVGIITAVILFVLWILPPFERFIDSLHDFFTFHITIKNSDKQEDALLDMFDDAGVKVVHVWRSQEKGTQRIVHVKVKTTPAKHAVIGRALANARSVVKFDM